ncbi:hypothetical protein JW930_07650 [Candidatus Woesearchaeota archaeon]|nr:hypothetical protein [Candidatus Woesearchaeota archaeon]
MKTISALVDEALLKHTKDSPQLKTKICNDLEFKLLFQINFSKPFKQAKKEFVKNYVNNILIFSFGNVSKAAELANINRRHLHRLINQLNVDIDCHRKQMINPVMYMKSNMQNVIEESIEDCKNFIDKDNLESLYSELDDITTVLADNLDYPSTFEESMDLFERGYIQKVLEEHNFEIGKAAEKLGMSERTLYRKINKLNISVV